MRRQTISVLLVLTSLLLTTLLGGCASNVTYDYNPDYPFATQDSYRFVDSPNAGANSLDQRRIRSAIQQTLSTKGLRETQEDADIGVRYRVEDTRRLESSGFSFGFGIGAGHGGVGISTAPPAREVKEGRLVLEIIDPQRNEVIWSATSRRNLSADMAPRKRAELVNEIVREMLANFPPRDEA